MKKMNGWLLIGICIAAIALTIGVLYVIGQLGTAPELPGHV